MITIEEVNALTESRFSELFGRVYEHMPQLAHAACGWRPFATRKALQAALEAIVFGLERAQQDELVRNHPDLAAKVNELSALTEDSRREQQRAGFGALPEEELACLRDRLEAYRERFGHPFILCVSEHSAEEVLPILEVRLRATPASEHAACLAQINRIGWHRICRMVEA